MALKNERVQKSVTINEDGVMHVAEVDRVTDGGTLIAESGLHRRVIYPDSDMEKEPSGLAKDVIDGNLFNKARKDKIKARREKNG